MQNQRCRHVVGKVGDHHGGATLENFLIISVQRVGVMDHDADGLDDAAKRCQEVTVNFDGLDRGTRFGQGQRERTQPRPDFEREVTFLHPSESSDFTNGIGVNDEVLTESPRGREAEFFE